jgi:hypothetical protein
MNKAVVQICALCWLFLLHTDLRMFDSLTLFIDLYAYVVTSEHNHLVVLIA